MATYHSKETEKLYEAVISLENTKECRKFFEDICTVKELLDLAQRLQIALMLKEGKNYQEISAETGASTATISRVNKCLLYGTGGYETVISKLNKDTEK
ncbi:MAG: TrpR YerC/YecD [Ruminococcaceae bacterium]|nr:TrpR YerC/YecD [Oscillospiraceae bacterium]